VSCSDASHPSEARSVSKRRTSTGSRPGPGALRLLTWLREEGVIKPWGVGGSRDELIEHCRL